MISKVKALIESEKLLLPNQSVIVGLSGGADSICLTHVLKNLGYTPIAVHVEHGIRGNEALSDAEFVKEFCLKNGIECYVEHIDIPKLAKEKKLSLETCGRIERYRIFNEYSEKFGCPVATAHNKNDQAETVILHLARGSGLNGLCGIKVKNGNTVRPLLSSSRAEIEEYCLKNNLQFVTDSTNSSDEYSRNSVRHGIIPKLEEINSNALSAIYACTEKLNEYKAFFDKTVENEYQKVLVNKSEHSIVFTASPNDKIICEEIIRKALCELNGNIVDIEKVHIDAILSLYEMQSGKEIHLPYDIVARKIYGNIEISHKKEDFTCEYDFEPLKKYNWINCVITSKFADNSERKRDSEYVDFDKLPKNLTLRTRRAGDYIVPLGMDGKVSLKKYFIDKKIPIDLRNTIPLLCSNNEVLVILGKTVSDRVKITDKTKILLNLYKE